MKTWFSPKYFNVAHQIRPLHLGWVWGVTKVNIVTDALSRKSFFVLTATITRLTFSNDGSILAGLRARPVFVQQICEAQKNDSELQAKRAQCESGCDTDF